MGSYRLGVDIGGTFTDLQLLDEENGELFEGKVPTTPGDLAEGFADGMRRVLGSRHVDADEVKLVVHGTTVVTNALLQRNFDAAGLVVTKGYRGVLEIGRVHVPGPFGTWLFYVPPPRVVPLEFVREVTERIDRRGSVLVALDEESVVNAAEFYSRKGIDAVGVSLMWSFVDDLHEQNIKEIFAKIYPACKITLSSEVLPQVREFERAFTTALTAALKPRVGAYLNGIESLLEGEGVGGRVMCVKSSGGAIGVRAGGEHPVELALSGPAAGVLGMAQLCTALGFSKAITVDMGGTSTDISFIEDGRPLLTAEGVINDYSIQGPLIDIHTIGAGGGSVAWIGAGGKARVGPRSAGSEPGPAAYGKGGVEPTLTDANIVLGRLPTSLLGGNLDLDSDRAAKSIETFGKQLGLETVDAALTIVELATHSMELAIRQVSTRKGRDPRECVLVAFGGAGPGHAGRLAELLQIPTVVLPPGPGVGSTFGLLSTDVRTDFTRSILVGMDDPDLEKKVAAVYGPLADQAWASLTEEGLPDDHRSILTIAGFRYAKQQYTIDVEVAEDSADWHRPPDRGSLLAACETFHEDHRTLCGFDYRGQGSDACELVHIRVVAIGHLSRPKTRVIQAGDTNPSDEALAGHRAVCFERDEGFVEIPVFLRHGLSAGNTIVGPAVIDEFDSTSLVLPDHRATVASDGSILISLGGK